MDPIEYRVDEGVAVVTLNRPERLNAFTTEMGRAYNEAVRAADGDPEVRVIVVTGAGRGFCAGVDLAMFAGNGAALREGDPGDGLAPEVNVTVRKPVIAAVNGAAVGVGFVLMLTADVRFVAEDAKLAASFTRLGLPAEYGSSWLLPRIVGVGNAMDLLLSGRRITGVEAGRIGLANRVLPAADVLGAALEYAADIARHCAPNALAAVKAQLWQGLHGGLDDAMARAQELMTGAFGSADLAEGALAHAERRAPSFAPLGGAPAASGIPW